MNFDGLDDDTMLGLEFGELLDADAMPGLELAAPLDADVMEGLEQGQPAMDPQPSGELLDGEALPDDDDAMQGVVETPPLHVLEHGTLSFEDNVIALPEHTDLRVMLWNVQDLGGGPSRPKSTREPEVKRAIATIIWNCHADFVGVLELKRAGARPRKPVMPTAPQGTRTNPFVARFGPDSDNGVDLGAKLSGLLYELVNVLVWNPAIARIDEAEQPEVASDELDEDDELEAASEPEDPFVATLDALDLGDCPSTAAIDAALRDVAFGLRARVEGLRDDADEVAKLDVEDWSTLPVAEASKWPKVPESRITKLRALARGAPPDSFRRQLETTYRANVVLRREHGVHDGEPDAIERHVLEQQAELELTAAWSAALVASPCPSGEDEAAQQDAKAWKGVQELDGDLVQLRAALPDLRTRWRFLRRVVREVLRPVGDAVAPVVGKHTSWSKTSELDLASAFLNAAIEVRRRRYDEAKRRYEKQLENLRNSGSYPGLLEFLDIAKQVCALAAEHDPEAFEYGVWPPLHELEAFRAEVDKLPGERGPIAQRMSQYFTSDEAYGVLYNRKTLIGPGDPLPGGRSYAFRPYFLSGFLKRAPLVVPLRVRKLDVDVRFVPWHAPAPSSGNADVRARDFPVFDAHAAAFRKRHQLAVFLSDTNVDSRAEMLDRKVEHWGSGAPTRRNWLLGITGDPKLFERADLLLSTATSLRKSKLEALPGGKRFVYHCAAYDKVLLLAATGSRGATLDYQAQQLYSHARTLLPRPVAVEDATPPSSPIEHPMSPIEACSYTLAEGFGATLRHEAASHRPEDQALQLVDDARQMSDHAAVLAVFRVTGPTQPMPDRQPLVDAFASAIANGQGVRAALDEILQNLTDEGVDVDASQLGGELLDAFPGHAAELQEIACPSAEQPISPETLRRILRGFGTHAVPFEGVLLEDELASPSFEALGLQPIENAGGGACLFYSLCDLRYGPPSAASTAYGLRVKAVAHLRALLAGEIAAPDGMLDALDEMLQWHAAGFPGAPAYAGAQWNTYLGEMAKPNAWGDLIMLSVVSHMLDQSFEVFVRLGEAQWRDEVRFGGSMEHAQPLFCDNQFHWQALAGAGGPLLGEFELPPHATSATGGATPVSFPFDTSARVVLWDTADASYFWSGPQFDAWGVRRWLFVFGDNGQRRGTGGQAGVRGEYNVVGLRTCKEKPGSDNQATFAFDDAEIDENKRWIEADLAVIAFMAKAFEKVVFPFRAADGCFDLGTNLAKMDTRAPLTFAWMQQRLREFVVALAADMDAAASPSGGPPSPSGGSGGPDDEHDDREGGGGPDVAPNKKRKAPSSPSSQGPFKTGGGETDSLQIQLCSLFGASSGAQGFGHEDVTAVAHDSTVLPLTVCEFPPQLGAFHLAEPARAELLSRFEQDFAGIEAALARNEHARLEIQPLWGGPYSPSLASEPEIESALQELASRAKRQKVTHDGEPDPGAEQPDPGVEQPDPGVEQQ